jgi:hypothetical protein
VDNFEGPRLLRAIIFDAAIAGTGDQSSRSQAGANVEQVSNLLVSQLVRAYPRNPRFSIVELRVSIE